MNMTFARKLRRTALCWVLAGAGGALTAGALTTGAQAGELDVRTQTVHFDELDLARPAGAQRLYQRLQRAALRVCASPGAAVWQHAAEDACIKRAVDAAVSRIGAPALTRLRFGDAMPLARIAEARE